MWKTYRQKRVISVRPYIAGEDMTGISIRELEGPVVGGWICGQVDGQGVQWYLSAQTIETFYEPLPVPRARQALRPGTKALKARPHRQG